MMIDLNRPVFLKRMIIDPHTGNVLPALKDRSYDPKTIPARFLNDTYCDQAPVKSTPVDIPDRVVEIPTEDKIPERELTTNEITPVLLNINSASLEEISRTLDGVGDKTAAKLDIARKEKPFISTADLDDRVPLALGRKWSSYDRLISFE